MNRIIGEYIGKDHGPLVICIGGIHGNELAGIKALDLVLKMLEVEPITNPTFSFKGKLLALNGNLCAIKQGKRFIDKDMNRLFIKERIDAFISESKATEYVEDQEALELITTIKQEIESYRPTKVILIDLHTTSSAGGIFTIVPDNPASLQVAKEMHAPVITGMTKGVRGTTMHYFTTDNLGVESLTISFESGQHDDPMAINIAIAAIVACLRAVNCVRASDVENLHDDLLINFSKNLPSVTKLLMKHSIKRGDRFQMKPNYLNFQAVSKDEIIAFDKNGPIAAQEDGILLMPLYQKQGEDGFFLIQTIPEYEIH